MPNGSPPAAVARPSYRDLLLSGSFCYGPRLLRRGDSRRRSSPTGSGAGRALLGDPRIGYISVTDSPGGVPMLPADWLGGLVSSQRQRVVLHLTCKDMNRNGLESACWRYAATGFDNVLALTGDYPTGGFGGTGAAGVRPRFARADPPDAVDERRARDSGPPRRAADAAGDQLLHRLRRLAVQAARIRACAAVLQAAPQATPAPAG